MENDPVLFKTLKQEASAVIDKKERNFQLFKYKLAFPRLN